MDLLKELEELAIKNENAEQKLERVPEPCAVTYKKESVLEYNNVLATNMVSNYVAGLELIFRSMNKTKNKNALDICSGPGFFSIFLKKYLNYNKVTGIDLSKPMVEVAKLNAKRMEVANNVSFQVKSALNLDHLNDNSFDLISFTNSAHHFESISQVKKVLKNAERLVKPDGMIILTDIGRLKTKEITEKFVDLVGRDFLLHNMPHMHEDFKNSMFAAWNAVELKQAIPKDTKRIWYQLIPQGLTNYLALISLPEKSTTLFQREGKDWLKENIFLSKDTMAGWQLLKGIIDQANYIKLKS